MTLVNISDVFEISGMQIGTIMSSLLEIETGNIDQGVKTIFDVLKEVANNGKEVRQ